MSEGPRPSQAAVMDRPAAAESPPPPKPRMRVTADSAQISDEAAQEVLAARHAPEPTTGIAADPPVAPAADATPETAESQQRQEELRQVADSVIDRSIQQSAVNVVGKLSEATEEEAEIFFATPEGQQANALLTLGQFRDIADGETTRADLFSEGSMEVTIGDRSYNLTDIGRNGDVFGCTVEGEATPVEIPRETFLDALKLTAAEALVQGLPEGSPQRAVVEQHIKTLKGEPLPAEGTSGAEKLAKDMKAVKDAEAAAQQAEAANTPEALIEVADKTINTQIINISVQIAEARAQGKNVSQLEDLLRLLKVGKRAHGEMSAPFKLVALQKALHGQTVSPQIKAAIEHLQAQLPETARVMIEKLKLTPEDVSSLVESNNDPELMASLLKKGLLDKVQELPKLIFGEDISDKEMQELLGIEPGEKNSSWLYYLISFLVEELKPFFSSTGQGGYG